MNFLDFHARVKIPNEVGDLRFGGFQLTPGLELGEAIIAIPLDQIDLKLTVQFKDPFAFGHFVDGRLEFPAFGRNSRFQPVRVLKIRTEGVDFADSLLDHPTNQLATGLLIFFPGERIRGFRHLSIGQVEIAEGFPNRIALDSDAFVNDAATRFEFLHSIFEFANPSLAERSFFFLKVDQILNLPEIFFRFLIFPE